MLNDLTLRKGVILANRAKTLDILGMVKWDIRQIINSQREEFNLKFMQ